VGRPVPAALARLPVCPVRHLPIPYSSGRDESGAGRFGVNDCLAKMACGVLHLCGICGEPLAGDLVFLTADPGVPLHQPVFPDPPNHEACADAALQWCPRIARPGPRGWLMWITGSYDLVPGRKALLDFRPGPAARIRRFAYDQDGRLAETG
jgi:hypothetical protein